MFFCVGTEKPAYNHVELVGVVNVDLGFSMGRFDVCTSMVAPTPDHSGPSGSTPATYVTRTIASIHATHETAGEWRIVVQGNGVFYSAVDSLEAYVIELQMQLEERAGMLRPCSHEVMTNSIW